jgi:PAS domain S-box-containing protein
VFNNFGVQALFFASNNPTEAALHKSQQSLIKFINSLDEGFELLELIFNHQGNVVDFVFLEVNPSYEKQTGLKAANLIGKRKKEVAPASEQRWYDYAIQAAKTGKTLHYQYYNSKVNRYFETQFIPISTNQIAVLFKDITEGKKNEAVLRAKEFELYSIYANVPEVLFFLSVEPDNHFRFVSVNQSFLDVTGLLENQVVGKTVQEVIPETSSKVVLEKYTQAIRENKTLTWEEITDYPAGKKYGEVSITPLFDSSGRCTNLVGSVHDVTERKKSEEVLRQSQLDLRLIFDSVNDGFWDWNMVSGKAVFSPKYFTMLGYEVGEFASDFSTLKSLMHPDDVKLVEKTIEACSKSKEPFAIEIRLKTKVGDWCWVSSRGKIVEWDNQGKPIRMVGAHTDISERKKMEGMLRDSRKKYQALTETTNDFVWEMDAQGRYTYCSPQMEKLWGLKPSDMIGKTPFDVMPPVDRERALELFLKMGNSSEPFKGLQTTAFDSQGHLIYVETNGVPFFDDGGRLLGFRGISRDITERKKLEKQLQDRERLAAIGATAGMVGHDIRNPLQAILSSLYLMKSDLDSMPKSEEKNNLLLELNSIFDQVNYTDKVVSDLQDYSRQIKPELVEADIKTLVTGALSTLNVPDNIEARAHFDKKVQKLRTDKVIMKRILFNLATNAIQAMPDGGKLTVNVYMDEKTSNLIITVEDTGLGIPKEVQDKLFTPLFTTKAKGQGLGLAVVKRLVEGLNGKVSFESEKDKGTKFIIELPAQG